MCILFVCVLVSLPACVIVWVVRSDVIGIEVIKLEFIPKLKIKHNDWLLADTCPQAANHCALLYSSFITSGPGHTHSYFCREVFLQGM